MYSAAASTPSAKRPEGEGGEAESLRIWHNTIDVLDGLYRVLLQEAARVRGDPGAGLKPLKGLLDQTRPQTEEARQLALFVRMLADFRRGEFTAYAFKIKKACLLLLLGPRGATTALNLEGAVAVRLEADGTYGLARADARAAPAPEGADGPPGGPKGASPRAGASARSSGREKARGRPKKEGAKPAMAETQYLRLLAQLDAAPALEGAAPAAPEGEPFPALKGAGAGAGAGTGRGAASRGAARKAPARAAYAAVTTGAASKLRSWDEVGAPAPSGASWFEISASNDQGDLSDEPYELEEFSPPDEDGGPAAASPPAAASAPAGGPAGAPADAPAASGPHGAPRGAESPSGPSSAAGGDPGAEKGTSAGAC